MSGSLVPSKFKFGPLIIIICILLRKSIIGSTNYQIERDGNILEIQLPVDFLGKLSSSEDMSTFEFRRPFIIQSVSDESLNKDYDIRQGDRIISVYGQEIKYADQLDPLLQQKSNQTTGYFLDKDFVYPKQELKQIVKDWKKREFFP